MQRLRMPFRPAMRAPFMILMLLFALVFVLFPSLKGHVLHGKVIQVRDGDTVVIAPVEGGEFFTCRLYGIDAPEIKHGKKPGQPYGEDATQELKQLILGQTVSAELTGEKTYNREVCIIKKDGMNINLEMIKLGYAWAYRQYLKRPYASEFIDAEKEARAKRLGLWQQVNPQPPWEFRMMTG